MNIESAEKIGGTRILCGDGPIDELPFGVRRASRIKYSLNAKRAIVILWRGNS